MASLGAVLRLENPAVAWVHPCNELGTKPLDGFEYLALCSVTVDVVAPVPVEVVLLDRRLADAVHQPVVSQHGVAVVDNPNSELSATVIFEDGRRDAVAVDLAVIIKHRGQLTM